MRSAPGLRTGDEKAATGAVPAIAGWFTVAEEPQLLGNRCTACGLLHFPKATTFCRSPDCDGDRFTETPLSRQGRIWSFTEAHYPPPEPYIQEPAGYQPFCIAAVELEAEKMVVLGQVSAGYSAADLSVGMAVELVVEHLFHDRHGLNHVVWKWLPVHDGSEPG
jgi:uncharacterized OB-fold protein